MPVAYWLFTPMLLVMLTVEQPKWKPLLVTVARRTAELTKWAVDTAYFYDIFQGGGLQELLELMQSRRVVVTPYNYQHALVNCTLLFGPAYLVLWPLLSSGYSHPRRRDSQIFVCQWLSV